MKRTPAIALLILLMSLVRPSAASAGLWAWLEEWSGPGPFKGYTFLFTGCMQDQKFRPSPIARGDEFHRRLDTTAQFISGPQSHRKAEMLRRLYANPEPLSFYTRATLEAVAQIRTGRTHPTPAILPEASIARDIEEGLEAARVASTEGAEAKAARLQLALAKLYDRDDAPHGPGHADPRLWCGYVDQGFFSARANPTRGFPAIRTYLIDIGPSVRLHDGVDLGVGLGLVTYHGKGVTASPHMSLTPMRLVMRPALMAVPEEYRRRWMGVLSVYWKETYIKGKLSAADFGSPTDPFEVDGELVRSFGFNVDITALFPAKWGFD